jgi:hypothetical protein
VTHITRELNRAGLVRELRSFIHERPDLARAVLGGEESLIVKHPDGSSVTYALEGSPAAKPVAPTTPATSNSAALAPEPVVRRALTPSPATPALADEPDASADIAAIAERRISGSAESTDDASADIASLALNRALRNEPPSAA